MMKFDQIRWGVLFIFTIFLLLKAVNATIPSNDVIFYNNLTRSCAYASYVYPIQNNNTYEYVYNSNTLQDIQFSSQNSPYQVYAIAFNSQDFHTNNYYFAGYNSSKNMTIPSYSYMFLANYTLIYFNTTEKINYIYAYLLKNVSCIYDFETPQYMHNFFSLVNGALIFSQMIKQFMFINSTTIEANNTNMPFMLAIPNNLTIDNLSYYFTNNYYHQFSFYQYIATNTLFNQIKSIGSISSQYITIPSNDVILKENKNIINTNPLSLVFWNVNNSLMTWQGLGILYNYTLYNYTNKVGSQISFNTHSNFYLNVNNNKFRLILYPIPLSFNSNFTFVNNTLKPSNTLPLGGYQYKINFTITNWNENYSFKNFLIKINANYSVFSIPNYTQLSSPNGPFTNMFINYSINGVNYGQVNFCVLHNSTSQNAYIVMTRKTLNNYPIENNTNVTIYLDALNPIFWKSYSNQTLCDNFMQTLTKGQMLYSDIYAVEKNGTCDGNGYYPSIIHVNTSIYNPVIFQAGYIWQNIYLYQSPTEDRFYITENPTNASSNVDYTFFYFPQFGGITLSSENLYLNISNLHLPNTITWENQSGVVHTINLNGQTCDYFMIANSTMTYSPPFSTNVKIYKVQTNNQNVIQPLPQPSIIIVNNNTISVNTTNLSSNQSNPIISFLKNTTSTKTILFNVKSPPILILLIIFVTLFVLALVISTKNMMVIGISFLIFSLVFAIISFEISILMIILSFIFIYINYKEEKHE